MESPKGAQYYVDGLHWKERGDKSYRHDGKIWLSSTREMNDIKRAARKQIND